MRGIPINKETDCPEGNPIRKPRCRFRNVSDGVFSETPGGCKPANGFIIEVSILEYCSRFVPPLADGISKNRSHSIPHPRGHSRSPVSESLTLPLKKRGGLALLSR